MKRHCTTIQKAIGILLMVMVGVLFLCGYSSAANSPTFMITVPEHPSFVGHIGYQVYLNGKEFCTKLKPSIKVLRCSRKVPEGELNFTVKVLGTYGRQSNSSPTTSFVMPAEASKDVPTPTEGPIVEIVNELEEIQP